MILAYFGGPGFLAVVLLVMSGCAGVAYLLTKLLARIKREFVAHDSEDSFPKLGSERWIASIVLGSVGVLGWGFLAFNLANPLRDDTIEKLCAAGLIALLAIVSQCFPDPAGQWPVAYGIRKVVAIVGWFAAFYVTMVALFA